VLPQTGAIAGLAIISVLGGAALITGLTVASKKNGTGGSSEKSLDHEYDEMFDN